MRRSISLYALLFLLTFFGSLSAQDRVPPTNVGREFYLSFPANWDYAVPEKYVRLYIISENATRVQVHGGPTLITTKRTIPGEILMIDIPLNFAQPFTRNDVAPIPPDQVYPNKGLRIIADDPVTVYGINRVTYCTEGVLALPIQSLGREYIVASSPDISDHNSQKLPSQYVITAPYDNTVVTIVNSYDTYGHVADETVTVAMNKGDVYSAMGKGQLSDLTGTVITSSRPIAVLAGQNCTYLPSRQYAACDHTAEMLLPIRSWGKVYHLVPFQNRLKGDFIRVFSGAPNTKISINGGPAQTLPDKGGAEGRGWFTVLEQDRRLLEFIADKPINVAQYNNSQQYDNVNTDPFYLVLTPMEQYQTALGFATPSTNYPSNFVSLVMDSSGWKDIEIMRDGSGIWKKLSVETGALPKNFPTLINGVRYSGVSFEIAPGIYRLRGTKPFAGYSYGWSSYDSYGYPLSVAAASISVDDPDAPLIEPTQDCLGNVEITTTDMPTDPNRRTNLNTIELDPASYNYSFNPRPLFDPNETQTTKFRLKVDDPASDAMAIVVISDGRGNASRDTFYYSAFNVAMSEDPTDFGSMSLNVNPLPERAMVLRNLGPEPVTIKEIMVKLGNRGFTIISPVGEFTLGAAGAPNDTKGVTVRFTPTAAGVFEDSIGVRNECGVRMMALLRADVGIPRIQVDDVSFGQVPVAGVPVYRTAVIRNTSTDGGVLVVTGVASGPSNHIVFTLFDTPVFPLRLGAGEESDPITLIFDPSAERLYTDTIRFTHNAGPDPGNDSLLVINGEGIITSGVVETGRVPGLSLGPIAPMPIDDRGTLSFAIPGRSTVEIIIVDATGRTVETVLERRVMEQGAHTLRFDVSALAAGSYFCRMSVGDRLLVQPLVVR